MSTLIATANLNFARPGDRAQMRHLRAGFGRRRFRLFGARKRQGLIVLQEADQKVAGRHDAEQDTRIVRVGGQPFQRQPRWELGDTGSHRFVSHGETVIDGQDVCVIDAHVLHQRSAGVQAHDEFVKLLAEITQKLTAGGHRWILLLNGNQGLKSIARVTGGTAYGDGIVGAIVSEGLQVRRQWIDSWAQRKGYTDHPECWFDVAAVRMPARAA